MDHTLIITTANLEEYANRRDSQGVIPELVYWLVKQSVSKLSVCRIPYGDAVNQPGMDGLVETEDSFLEFVPKGISYWEIGTGNDPQKKATIEFRKRTKRISDEERAKSAFIFVTPRSSGSEGWNEPKQGQWLKRRKDKGWGIIRIIDGVKIADWLREFPALGRWMAKKINLSKSLSGLTTPTEHWEMIQAQTPSGDPPLPPQIFILGRDHAVTALQGLFEEQAQRLLLFSESPKDVEDFVAGYLASLGDDIARAYRNRCLFINDEDAWRSVIETRKSHVLVADPHLGLDSEKADLQTLATRKGHAVIIPICGAWSGENPQFIKLRSPSQSQLETTLKEAGYSTVRARELASIGADRLSALRRHLLGLGSLPPYATWDNARLLAQAGLIGKWDGKNKFDQSALENLLGKEYGEWIEIVRPDVLRSDTPLIQQDEKWRMLARGEAWSALGPHLNDNDLDKLYKISLQVLGERDPQFDLPKEERYAANIHGKKCKHSSLLRAGIAETLALIGSRPNALSSCSTGKANMTALLTIRGLLEKADWERWASLDHLLPLLAEAAPDEFLDSVELALENLEASPFHKVFSQEGGGVIGGRAYTCGLLWALETLAWHPDYLTRTIVVLGDLASIDPGGQWSNRPSNSLADILLPWHPQTCASIEKRKVAVKTLLKEQPEVGWKLLLALLPHSHSTTSGCHRPTWRNLISTDWKDTVTQHEYWEQISIYTDLAIRLAKSNTDKLKELISRLSDLPKKALENLLDHLVSKNVKNLPEIKRLPLWEVLTALVRKHRRFAKAEWSMPENIVAKIEATADALAPKAPELRYQVIFSGRDYDLYEESGHYDEQRNIFDSLRQKAIQEIFDIGGVPAILDFSKKVSSPNQVGVALGNIAANSIESELLPKFLQTKDEILKNLISGFVLSKYWKLGWPWVDKLLVKDWSATQKGLFLTLLPFENEVWTRVEEHLQSEDGFYWQNVFVNPWGQRRDLTKAIEKLIHYNRPNAAVQCVWRSVDEDGCFDSDLATRALLGIISSTTIEKEFDQDAIIEVIIKLQNCSSTDADALFKIEWNFLFLLDQFSRGRPKTLEYRLAKDPTFFCEVISLVFRSKNEDKKVLELSEQQKRLAEHAYKLLSEWKITPGVQPDSSFDANGYSAWLTEAKRIAEKTGHLDIALSQLGHVLTYTPKDEDGLWIHHIVAESLNAKDAKTMRSGFTTELFDQRGTYGFSAGEEERKIARINREKAEALEARGYSRFATAMREFAESYERDAERESVRNPYER